METGWRARKSDRAPRELGKLRKGSGRGNGRSRRDRYVYGRGDGTLVSRREGGWLYPKRIPIAVEPAVAIPCQPAQIYGRRPSVIMSSVRLHLPARSEYRPRRNLRYSVAALALFRSRGVLAALRSAFYCSFAHLYIRCCTVAAALPPTYSRLPESNVCF